VTVPCVEILTFDGCPNRSGAVALVDRVLSETGIAASVEVVDVSDPEMAAALRFLGSPTIRVDGQDVEPGAAERRGFALACRVYRTEAGLQGQPDARWLAGALARSAG
jgi:hypothetical protein